MTIPAVALGAMKLAVGVTSAAAGVAQSINANKRQGELYEQNGQAAKDAYFLETHLTNKKLMDERKATSQKKQDNSIKRMKASATALTAAATGGVQGGSVSQVLDDYKRSEGVVSDRLDQSLESAESQSVYNMMGSQAKAQARINSIPLPDNSNIYASVIRGAGSVMGEFSDFKDLYDGDYDV
ncbi:hypothetical protein [uncultured Pseudosulfitobacter sp.]|mgnify:FL=1|uniref:virion core protein, T7 gp14 family n=1 Tax=uncultured Pseudosulfitobacter sp. TaxID=2854214 RepID=UPI0030DB578F|tara:strand:- start:324 stop:872 length:549 start_codon:yes stop_codon:yes gene_type:complete